MVANKRFIQVEAMDGIGNIFLKRIYDMKINFRITADGVKYYKGNHIILRPYWITRKDVEVMYELGNGFIEIIPDDLYNINYSIKKSRKRLWS